MSAQKVELGVQYKQTLSLSLSFSLSIYSLFIFISLSRCFIVLLLFPFLSLSLSLCLSISFCTLCYMVLLGSSSQQGFFISFVSSTSIFIKPLNGFSIYLFLLCVCQLSPSFFLVVFLFFLSLLLPCLSLYLLPFLSFFLSFFHSLSFIFTTFAFFSKTIFFYFLIWNFTSIFSHFILSPIFSFILLLWLSCTYLYLSCLFALMPFSHLSV